MHADRDKQMNGRTIVDRVKQAAFAAAGFVRRHWRLALLGALVVLFMLGPGYTANRSDFYQRFEGLGAYYTTWDQSTHANVSCQSCHVDPGAISQGVYAVRMVGEVYMSLLPLDREPDTLGSPVNAACEGCHIDLRSVSPAGDLLIPHTAHVDALEIECIVCHVSELVHNENPEVSTTPRMATCLTCHNGEVAKEDCDACHTDKAIPESHQETSFIVDHSTRQEQIDCTSCHAWHEAWCADCHARRPRSHGSGANPAEWRKAHRDAVELRDLRNCEACHEGDFCIECHGIVPERHLDPTLTLVR